MLAMDCRYPRYVAYLLQRTLTTSTQQCNQGHVWENGSCVPLCVPECPSNSSPAPYVDGCVRDPVVDCWCDEGYLKNNGYCVPDNCALQCPPDSFPLSLSDCVQDPALDCQCDEGYIWDNGVCVERDDCIRIRDCGPNSHRRDPGSSSCLTPTSYYSRWKDECECDPGYWWDRYLCIPDCTMFCPPHSSPMVVHGCIIDPQEQCFCKVGYKWHEGSCIPEADCPLKCPPHSHAYPYGDACIQDTSECRYCIRGYAWHEGSCVPEAACPLKCPPHSHSKSDNFVVHCIQDISLECYCDQGYYLSKDGTCLPECTLECPPNTSRLSLDDDCVQDPLQDCLCGDGYVWKGEECVDAILPTASASCPYECPANSNRRHAHACPYSFAGTFHLQFLLTISTQSLFPY